MKPPWLAVTTGGLLGAALVVVAAFAIGWIWGPLYGGEEDMARNVRIFLGAMGAGAVGGAFLGYRISRKQEP